MGIWETKRRQRPGFADFGCSPIASDSQIKAAVHRGTNQTFVTIQGPCGDGHTMNLREARALRDWLIREVPSDAADKNNLVRDRGAGLS